MNILQKINVLIYEDVSPPLEDFIPKIKSLWRDIYDSDREDFVYDIFKDYGIVLTDEEKESQDITKLTKLSPPDLKDVYELMGGE